MADGDQPQEPVPPTPGTPYSADQPTANEQLLNSAIYHGLSLERVSAGMAADIKDVLVKAQEEIVGKLQSGTLTDWQTKRAQQFLDWSNKTIANAYDKINGNVADTLDGVKVAEIAKQTNSINQALGVEISPAMSTQQLESIAKADELLVNGAVMGDWWKKQAVNLQHQVKTTVQQGLALGKSTQDIAKDLRDFLPTDDDISQKQAVAQANALARTAAATVQSEAQQAYYKENDDIIKGIQWVSTLDDRTTPECQAMDGNTYQYDAKGELVPVGHDQPWPGFPPIHWNCRSTTVPVLKSWQELSTKELPHLDDATVQEAFEQNLADQGFTPEQIADISMNQRASVDGTVPASTTYEDWLNDQPELTQKSILGPARWQLWHDGAVTLKDMINKQTLEPLTVDELVAAAKENKAVPAPPPPVEGKYGLTLAENQILTAQMTSGATSGEQWTSWFNPENGVRIDQALKSSMTQDENAQLQAQKNLIHLTNSLSNTTFWNKSDASLWASQPGFQSAKLSTPSGRVITAKLKPGKVWTSADVNKYWAKLQEYRERMDEFDAQEAAFKATGKMIVTETMPGALQLDSSTMKKVYGPVHAEDKPLSFLQAHAQQEQLQKDAELSSKMADIKAQLKQADQAQQDYAEQSQLAREKQAELQTMIAQRDLETATQAKKEADDLVAKQNAQHAQIQEELDAIAADQAAAQRAQANAQDALAAHEKAAQEAKELEAKIAAQKAAEAAAKAAQEQADIAASLKARYDAKDKQLDAASTALDRLTASQQSAANIQAAHEAEVAAKKAQEKEIKKQKAAAKKAAKLAKQQAAAVNTQGQMELTLEPKADVKTNFPADPMSLKVIQRLGGSTGAELVEDADGNKYVRKKDTNKGQVNDEFVADQIYSKAGINTPEGKLYSTPQGPVKLTKYIDGGKLLNDYLATASPVEKQQIMLQIRRGFVTDAWLGNWDVAGLGLDNILVDKNGNAYRIDNGGSLRYRGMGSKKTDAQFGNTVGELDSLRNPSTAPQAAKLFAGITDQEIVDQLAKLYSQKDELLAMFPADLRAKMAARLDYIDNYATELVAQGKAQMPGSAPPDFVQHVQAAPKPPEWVDPAERQKITDSNVSGMSIWTDKGMVEDANTLVWTETNGAGKRETVAQLKLTPEGIEKLEDLLKPIMPSMPAAYSAPTAQPLKTLPSDTFYNKILGGVKTINYHTGDGGYNQGKVAEALALKQPLGKLLITGDTEEKKMALTYLKTIKDIEDSIAQKPTTGKLAAIPPFSQYERAPTPPTPAPVVPTPTPTPAIKATASTVNFVEKKLSNGGEAVHLTGVAPAWASTNIDTILLDMGDIKARFVPETSRNERYAFALKGQVEVRVEGEATSDVMQKIEAGFKQLGIDVTPPTDEYKKVMYLTKNIYFLNHSELPLDVVQIVKDAAMSDTDKLAKIEEIAKRDFKIPVTKMGDRWQGQMPASGDGYRYFMRADITEEKLATDMAGYWLKHNTSTDMPTLIQAFLDGGGEITPTTERLRKGVSIKKTGGMSPEADLGTGGASYYFTRITATNHADGGTLYWPSKTLARLDIYSYQGDMYGNVKDPAKYKKRATSIAKYKSFAQNNGSNETNLRNGSSLFDLQYIGAYNQTEKNKILDVLRKNGITQWPDGRSIDDVVILAGQSLPQTPILPSP